MTQVLKFVLIVFCLSLNTIVLAQNNPSDNRSVKTLPKGSIQLDGIFGMVESGDFNTKSWQGLLRYGLKNNFELQLSYIDRTGIVPLYYRHNNALPASTNSAVRAGLKMYLMSEKDYSIGVSLLAGFNITTNTDNTPFLPSLQLLLEKNIGVVLIQAQGGLWFNGNNDSTGTTFNVSAELDVMRWLDFRVGLTGLRTNPSSVSDFNLTNEYLEMGAKLWIADGVSIYPHYDLGLGDDVQDVFSLGLLLNLK